MPEILMILLMMAAGAVLAFAGAAARRRGRIRQALAEPFPEAWRAVLEKDFPIYARLTDAERAHLERNIRIFLATKFFEGCGGLELTDEMRVLVAAQACLLLLNRDAPCYPRLRSVLVYPSTYDAGGRSRFGGERPSSVRLGESWGHGAVVLAWDSVQQGARNLEDGRNVTLHEFAHQLDQADGAADGAPVLPARAAYASWARVLSADYERLQRRARAGRRSVMDNYGATNPAEFFAVATETFFEKPQQLREKRPELYEELKRYYAVDPERWQK